MCEACGTDLTDLVEAARVARQLWARAWKELCASRVSEALSHAQMAATLEMGEPERQLLGWLRFLTGSVEGASRTWYQVPPAASRIALAYNQALSAARSGDHNAARSIIGPLDLPMPQILSLRNALGLAVPASGNSAAAVLAKTDERLPTTVRADRSQHGWRNAVTALVVLAAGFGSGYLAFGREQPPSAAETAGGRELITQPPLPNLPEESPATRELGRAFLSPSTHLLSDILEDREVEALPDSLVGWIPEPARWDASLIWYRSAIAAQRADEHDTALRGFKSSLMAVGAAADAYWIDDALYALVTSESISRPEQRRYAEFIARLHAGSMFDNSVVGSMVRSNEGEAR
jgi:hypothetical protein